MLKAIKYKLLLVPLFAMLSCAYEFPDERQFTEQDLGELNTENVIAFGDGFLAGAMDGALYSVGQENSVPAIIAGQLNEIKNLEFIQPEINSENGYNFYASKNSTIYGKWIYKFDNQTQKEPNIVLTSGQSVGDYTGDKSRLNNLAIPMLSVKQLDQFNLNSNPYFPRIFEMNGENPVVQTVQKSPTFIVCWIGMNDFINYAKNGADDQFSLTSVETFRMNFNLLVDELIKNTNATIILANLIPIGDLPFFYAQTYDNLFISNGAMGSARAKYKQFNLAVAQFNRTVPEELQRPFIDFYDNGVNPHPQPLVVIDSTLSDAEYPDGKPLEKYRQLSENEMLLMSVTDKMMQEGYGWLIPLEKKYYLSETEIELISARTEAFNAVISELAGKYSERIALADLKNEIHKIAETGETDAWGDPVKNEIIYFNGVPVEGTIKLNGIFSLDGLHFNQRGNAYLTNIFIRNMNMSFGSNIPALDINSFIGNVYTYQNF